MNNMEKSKKNLCAAMELNGPLKGYFFNRIIKTFL